MEIADIKTQYSQGRNWISMTRLPAIWLINPGIFHCIKGELFHWPCCTATLNLISTYRGPRAMKTKTYKSREGTGRQETGKWTTRTDTPEHMLSPPKATTATESQIIAHFIWVFIKKKKAGNPYFKFKAPNL